MKKIYVTQRGLSRKSTLMDLNNIKRISGMLNVYFPFELKNHLTHLYWDRRMDNTYTNDYGQII